MLGAGINIARASASGARYGFNLLKGLANRSATWFGRTRKLSPSAHEAALSQARALGVNLTARTSWLTKLGNFLTIVVLAQESAKIVQAMVSVDAEDPADAGTPDDVVEAIAELYAGMSKIDIILSVLTLYAGRSIASAGIALQDAKTAKNVSAFAAKLAKGGQSVTVSAAKKGETLWKASLHKFGNLKVLFSTPLNHMGRASVVTHASMAGSPFLLPALGLFGVSAAILTAFALSSGRTEEEVRSTLFDAVKRNPRFNRAYLEQENEEVPMSKEEAAELFSILREVGESNPLGVPSREQYEHVVSQLSVFKESSVIRAEGVDSITHPDAWRTYHPLLSLSSKGYVFFFRGDIYTPAAISALIAEDQLFRLSSPQDWGRRLNPRSSLRNGLQLEMQIVPVIEKSWLALHELVWAPAARIDDERADDVANRLHQEIQHRLRAIDAGYNLLLQEGQGDDLISLLESSAGMAPDSSEPQAEEAAEATLSEKQKAERVTKDLVTGIELDKVRKELNPLRK